MERKIGEIFEYNGEWYQCVEGNGCEVCIFNNKKCYTFVSDDDPIGYCEADRRKDNKDVIFKKLEKVGEPYRRRLSPLNSIMVQRYRLYGRNVIMPDEPYMYFNAIDNTIEIEIKQNKEDMEKNKLNLKPFDIQKAREGKPVCTRDGCKARIICFDSTLKNYPLVVLIEGDTGEYPYVYTAEGKFDEDRKESNFDLMMLPEKKEGWAVIRRSDIYETEEQAKEVLLNSRVGVMIRKIEWEE